MKVSLLMRCVCFLAKQEKFEALEMTCIEAPDREKKSNLDGKSAMLSAIFR